MRNSVQIDSTLILHTLNLNLFDIAAINWQDLV
jgi:hypothetical protein